MRLAATLSLIAALVFGNLHQYSSLSLQQTLDAGNAKVETLNNKQLYLNLTFFNLFSWIILSLSYRTLEYLDSER